MPVVRVGKHTIRLDESDAFTPEEEVVAPKGLTLSDAKKYRNRGDKWDGRYEGERAERIRLARIRQKARQKQVDCPITWEEWQQFLRDNHVEDIKGVEIRVINPEKAMSISNLRVVGLD